MTEKRLILSLFFLFALGAAYVFTLNEKGLDPDHKKSWWSLAFTLPNDRNSLVFTIVNHTDATDFRYAIDIDGMIVRESTLSVPARSSLDHDPLLTLPPSTKATITVWQANTHQTIFR